MKTSLYDLYKMGYKRATKVNVKRSNNVSWSKSINFYRSPDQTLKLEFVKLKLLVIVNRLSR